MSAFQSAMSPEVAATHIQARVRGRTAAREVQQKKAKAAEQRTRYPRLPQPRALPMYAAQSNMGMHAPSRSGMQLRSKLQTWASQYTVPLTLRALHLTLC